MLCKNPQLWVFGSDNIFAELGLSACAVSWIESLMIGSTVVILVAVAGLVAQFARRLIDAFDRKVRD